MKKNLLTTSICKIVSNTMQNAVRLPFIFAPLAYTTFANAEDFSVIVLPDTQNYSQHYPEVYDAQTEWIADNIFNYDIEFVSHLGDLVNNAQTLSEWDNAYASMSTLDDANVPYGVIAGNHDFLYPGDYYDPTGTNYLAYFGPQHYADQPWYKGASPSGLSNYQVIEVGDEEFLFLHLTMETPAAELAWAQTILNENQDKPVWVSTHRYLFDWSVLGAGRYDDFNYTFEPLYRHDGIKSEDFFNNFVAANRQIYLVHCGHNHSEYRQSSENNFGLTVHEVLADFQDDPNGGNGWLRICTLKPEQNQIQVQTYSPYLNEWQTDADSAFTLEVDFDAHKAPNNGGTIQLQNGIEGYNGTQDTWINEDSPNSSYGNSTILVVDDDVRNAWFSENPGQSLLKFTDFSQGPVYEGDPAPTRIPSNATVLSAQLHLTLSDDQDLGNSTYRVYPMTRSWNESSTWNSMSGGINEGSETLGQIASFKGDNNPNNNYGRTLNVTNTMRSWVDGSLNNEGFALIRDMTNGNDDGIDIHSCEASSITQRPKLTVEVTYPVLNRPPVVESLLTASSLTVNEGEEVQLTMAASDANTRDPLIFMLENVDVGFATGKGSVEHHVLFEDEGTYRFSGSVKDDETTVSAGEITVTVNNLPPIIITILQPRSIPINRSTSLRVEATDAGTYDVLSYAWDLDSDGHFETEGKDIQAQFETAGNHEVFVKVTDDDGASTVQSTTITVN